MPKWIRVRDVSTGHETDIDSRSMRHGFELVADPDRWPDLDGPGEVPRPPLYFLGKDGKAATPAQPTASESETSPPAETTTPPADTAAIKKGRS